MADQEFLASFGVEIDESGVKRLQAALEENRTLAEELASSFDNARTSVQAFFRELDEIALPGTVVSFDASSQTAVIQPAVKVGSMTFPLLADVPVFMPVTFEVNPGDACLVVFADIDIDAFLETGEASVPRSARRHALSDGFAFVGFRTGQ